MRINELAVSDVKVKEGHWKKYQGLLGDMLLPRQWEFLSRVNGTDAFKAAAGQIMPSVDPKIGAVHGTLDVGKLMEAIGYHLCHHDDPEWRRRVDELIDAMSDAQLSDGFLLPIRQMKGLEGRFANLLTEHEVYRMGNMIEGLLSYYEATGYEKALAVAKRLGDCMCLHFGKGKIEGYDGHPSVEIALIKLYRKTGEQKYLEIQRFFVEARGTQPHYYAAELEKNLKAKNPELDRWDVDRSFIKDFSYFCAHKPIRDMDEPAGHAVRALYFYAGVADLAYETGDETLLAALRRIWDALEASNVYVTGGVGQHAHIEAIGAAYDLPPDDAYTETCASVALVFWAQRMFRLDPDVRYADMIERALYNGILSGLSLDGTGYFYVNPLEAWPGNAYRKDKSHVLYERPSWFNVACCPPSLARIIGEVGIYFYMAGEGCIYVNQYAESDAAIKLDGRDIALEQRTRYPEDGSVSIRVQDGGRFALALRRPYWANAFLVSVNGQVVAPAMERGYAVIDREWQAGDMITIDMPMEARRVYAHPLARHMDGCVALQRGPLVYCLEEADNFPNLRAASLPDGAELREVHTDLLEGTIVLEADGCVDETGNVGLYTFDPPEKNSVPLRFIPYYKWANRGANEMLVWIRRS